jgi:hypothetical protein
VSLKKILSVSLALVCALGVSGQVLASDVKVIVGTATGQIVFQDPFCGPPEVVCQTANVTGKATFLGSLTGVLSERVNILTGAYTGTATFRTSGGDTFNTVYVGQVVQQTPDGIVTFVEKHTIVGGTGRLAGASGELNIGGTADATGAVSVTAVGTLVK